MSRKLKGWLLGLIFLFGLLIMLIALLSDPLIRHMGNQEVDDMTAEKVEAAKRKSANFDYSTVKMLNPVSVSLDAVQNAAQNAIQSGNASEYASVGKVAIPNVSLRLPIGKDWAIRSCHEVPAPCRKINRWARATMPWLGTI